MPQKDPDEYKKYQKEHYRKNKEKRLKYAQQYRSKNDDKIKEWRKNNEDKIKNYRTTSKGIKQNRIGNWKTYGIICDDWDVLYQRYLNTEFCELCNIKLTEDKTRKSTTRCLDHDHNTGEVRNIVCHGCNIKVG